MILADSEWPLFSNSYGKVFGKFELVNAGALVDLDPVQIHRDLCNRSKLNRDSPILIRLAGPCPLAVIALLVHLARRLPLQGLGDVPGMQSSPPICLWLTPNAYLDLGEVRHIIVRSIGYENVAFFSHGRSTAALKIDAAIIAREELS